MLYTYIAILAQLVEGVAFNHASKRITFKFYIKFYKQKINLIFLLWINELIIVNVIDLWKLLKKSQRLQAMMHGYDTCIGYDNIWYVDITSANLIFYLAL